MSLGFLTESALVPSKAKEIKVDAKSLVDLKAVVFQKDQERKRRLQEALAAENDDEPSTGHGALRLGKYAHLRGSSKRRKRSDEDRVGKKSRNSGVEARNRRDEEARQREAPDEDDDEAWRKKSAEMLRKKAKLYEEMANRGGKGSVKEECLVDFEAKKYTAKAVGAQEKTMVEITDEFGRTRSVATDSGEYSAFLGNQQQYESDLPRNEVEMNRPNYADEDKYRYTEGKAGGGSFVVSQWEKRLKTTEKKHLKGVHERATLAQALAHSTSSGTVDRKTRKQLRLERLRKQREGTTATNEELAQTNAAGDSAASDKATDFLNQLSSLM
ncbi:hypothetical protein PF005_g1076 [Phytophthora fragariae]|uniref:Uncharacterized protein n=1 Tax=Phytophthora fragariae TaxID=53985 RepID=A0A6A3UTB0_9STRA|nr:hypothetical protein PF003_g13376 [Phytophthora fragariae]KAE8949335.1 hypothetical protein PF009_g1081 [Phytophthora fragariae]KAE9030381.1 hypothetical protein PF011_g661 [Phytophthora fragariae]KAE9138660.1 hypothetical protein PF010_g901 [Phytophthora fragariae]KAE9139658.1 hypothetical protein PF007_g930 [Phytophthora fragariae]